MKEKLFEYVEKNKSELFRMLCEMVNINTENFGGSGNEKYLAEYLKGEYEKIGLDADLYSPDSVPNIKSHPDYLAGRNLEDRPNITVKVSGSAPKKSLMLAGHLDTVPIGDERLWTVPPVKGTIKDGKIYGRGANDDKHSLAIQLFLAKAFKELGVELKNNLYLSGYVDEEFGGGDGALACCVKYPCDFYINIDSDYMDIIHCGVGGQRLAIELKHPDPKDSCEDMIEAIYLVKKEIDKFGDRRKAEMSKDPYFKDTDVPRKALRYMNVVTGLNTNDRNRGVVDFAFYTDRPWETIKNEYDELFAAIDRAVAPLGIKIDNVIYRSRFFRYAAADKEHKCIKMLRGCAQKALGRDLKVCGMCLSDLNVFINNSNGNAISCGVCRGFADEGGAHQPNEYVICDELVEFTKLLVEFILEWDRSDD